MSVGNARKDGAAFAAPGRWVELDRICIDAYHRLPSLPLSLDQIATALKHWLLRWREARLRQAALRAWEQLDTALREVSEYALSEHDPLGKRRNHLERRWYAAIDMDHAAFRALYRFYEKNESLRPADFSFSDACMQQLQHQAAEN